MKNRTLLLAHSFGFCALWLTGYAHAEEPAWLKCRLESPEKQLECYQNATEHYLADQSAPSSPPPAENLAANPAEPRKAAVWKLDQLWPLRHERSKTRRLANTFLPYRQNYFLASSTKSPGDAPTSPNPLNRAVAGTKPQSSELAYQISLKVPLPFEWPWEDTLWFAYTQQSRWQAFKSSDSRPFRESNYEPELIFLSHRFNDSPLSLGAWTSPLTPRFLNLSYVHQSNGQTLPRSRSWNRLTAQLGSEYRFPSTDDDASIDKRIAVLIRPWWRIPEKGADDDNSDIVRFLGHGDIEIDYWRGRDLYTVLLRERAVQFDWSFPLSEAENALNLHLQYFNGYGQTLIDYNHKVHALGIGFSLPY